MHIGMTTILNDIKGLATWYNALVATGGGLVHKIWSKVVGAEKVLGAEIAKLEAEAAAASTAVSAVAASDSKPKA